VQLKICFSVNLRSFYITDSFFLAGTQNYYICWQRLPILNLYGNRNSKVLFIGVKVVLKDYRLVRSVSCTSEKWLRRHKCVYMYTCLDDALRAFSSMRLEHTVQRYWCINCCTLNTSVKVHEDTRSTSCTLLLHVQAS
jgi:hypothetical protein